jgi:hypothetical protein
MFKKIGEMYEIVHTSRKTGGYPCSLTVRGAQSAMWEFQHNYPTESFRRVLRTAGMEHRPAFCEQKGTTAEGSRAAGLLCKILSFCTECAATRRALGFDTFAMIL